MEKKLLVVIDPQNDFTSLDGHYAHKHLEINQIIETKNKINSLVKLFGHDQVVIVSSNYKPDQFEKGLSICIPTTFGHKIDSDFQFDSAMRYFTKIQHSCFSSNEFKEYLKLKQIDNLFLSGFLSEYCVRQTALDALELGYKVYLIEDCIATGDDVQIRKKRTINELEIKGVIVLNSSYFGKVN